MLSRNLQRTAPAIDLSALKRHNTITSLPGIKSTTNANSEKQNTPFDSNWRVDAFPFFIFLKMINFDWFVAKMISATISCVRGRSDPRVVQMIKRLYLCKKSMVFKIFKNKQHLHVKDFQCVLPESRHNESGFYNVVGLKCPMDCCAEKDNI